MSLDVPVAGYETATGLASFRDLIAQRAVDIVQPDVIWTGGITVCRKVAALAQAYGLPVVPHVFSSAVAAMANMHFIASLPNGGLLEFDQNPNLLRSELFEEAIEVELRRQGAIAGAARTWRITESGDRGSVPHTMIGAESGSSFGTMEEVS